MDGAEVPVHPYAKILPAALQSLLALPGSDTSKPDSQIEASSQANVAAHSLSGGESARCRDGKAALLYAAARQAVQGQLAEESSRATVRGALSDAFVIASKSGDASSSSDSAKGGPPVGKIDENNSAGAGLAEDWALLALAMALPLISTGLARDEHGCCVVPHPHPLVKRKVRVRRYINHLGRPSHQTGRACDNCDGPITENVYFSCAQGCDVDFCIRCQGKLESLFVDLDQEHVAWITRFVPLAGVYILTHLSSAARHTLTKELAFVWPTSMFDELVGAVVDVANAKVVHVQECTSQIHKDVEFWSTIGFLQILYAANQMLAQECKFGELTPRGPRIPISRFVVSGIDKCDSRFEWDRWIEAYKINDVQTEVYKFVLNAERVDVDQRFASFLTHSNLVPVSFWSRCLQSDVADSFTEDRIRAFHVEVDREDGLLEVLIRSFGEESVQELVCRPLCVKFRGEPASGPGVNTEFLHLAIPTLMGVGDGEKSHWECDPELRTWWFRFPGEHGCSRCHRTYRALGVLFGQTIVSRNVLPLAFPPVLFELLLGGLGSSMARKRFSLSDLAGVCPSVARSLEKLLEYTGEDIAELFVLDWPKAEELGNHNKGAYVSEYVQWYFLERYDAQLKPLVEGFRSAVGGSKLLKTLVCPSQLEQLLCGAEAPIDTDAIQAGAVVEDWPASEKFYVEEFWKVFHNFTESEKQRFVIFVSASSRTPTRGWQDLGLRVQRNGVGDDRLPTAFTCFTLLLLPRYSSTEVLQARLRMAIANTEGFGLN